MPIRPALGRKRQVSLSYRAILLSQKGKKDRLREKKNERAREKEKEKKS
jgi:hypothetical protein